MAAGGTLAAMTERTRSRCRRTTRPTQRFAVARPVSPSANDDWARRTSARSSRRARSSNRYGWSGTVLSYERVGWMVDALMVRRVRAPGSYGTPSARAAEVVERALEPQREGARRVVSPVPVAPGDG